MNQFQFSNSPPISILICSGFFEITNVSVWQTPCLNRNLLSTRYDTPFMTTSTSGTRLSDVVEPE